MRVCREDLTRQEAADDYQAISALERYRLSKTPPRRYLSGALNCYRGPAHGDTPDVVEQNRYQYPAGHIRRGAVFFKQTGAQNQPRLDHLRDPLCLNLVSRSNSSSRDRSKLAEAPPLPPPQSVGINSRTLNTIGGRAAGQGGSKAALRRPPVRPHLPNPRPGYSTHTGHLATVPLPGSNGI